MGMSSGGMGEENLKSALGSGTCVKPEASLRAVMDDLMTRGQGTFPFYPRNAPPARPQLADVTVFVPVTRPSNPFLFPHIHPSRQNKSPFQIHFILLDFQKRSRSWQNRLFFKKILDFYFCLLVFLNYTRHRLLRWQSLWRLMISTARNSS